jgi:hypothetical protein
LFIMYVSCIKIRLWFEDYGCVNVGYLMPNCSK